MFFKTLILLTSLVSANAEIGPSNDPVLWGTVDVPNFFAPFHHDALERQLNDPKNYPSYIYRPEGGTRSKVGRFLIDGKVPTGPVRCEHIEIYRNRDEKPLNWEAGHSGASNVFHHVHVAIDYFRRLSKLLGSKELYRETNPVMIRLERDTDWAMWIRFAANERFNTSQTFPDVDPDNWGTPAETSEIWFFIPKRMYLPKYVAGRYIPGVNKTALGTMGFPLDSARVPTVIYHEWVHLMTKPHLGITKNTVLNEGYSDYYGSVIGGRPLMGDSEEFSSFPYDRDYSKDPKPAALKDHQEPGLFIPRLFWKLRRQYGADRTDKLLWQALGYLSPKSELKDLPVAVSKALAANDEFKSSEQAAIRTELNRLVPPLGSGRKGS